MTTIVTVLGVAVLYLAIAGQASGPAALAGLGAVVALALYFVALWRGLRAARPRLHRAPVRAARMPRAF